MEPDLACPPSVSNNLQTTTVGPPLLYTCSLSKRTAQDTSSSLSLLWDYQQWGSQMRAMKITWRGGGKQSIPRGIYKEPKQGWTGWRFFIAWRSQLGGVHNSCQSSGRDGCVVYYWALPCFTWFTEAKGQKYCRPPLGVDGLYWLNAHRCRRDEHFDAACSRL